MAWETGPRGQRYYTRSRRIGGRVVREYVGGGVLGELAAAEDAERRARLGRDRAERERMEEDDALVEGFCDTTDAIVRAACLAAGYVDHRGEWRSPRARDS